MEVPLSGGGTAKNLGNEINVTVKKPCAGMMLEVGGGAFFPDEVAEDVRGTENALWAYAQGTTRF